MLYLDSETCGLHGLAVLIQYAIDDGPVILHDVWRTPIEDTLSLIEMFCEHEVCGFNLVFDWFHMSKLYTTFSLLPDKERWPEDCIDEIAIAEERARFENVCIRPKAALDLMLKARRGEMQTLMQRDPVRIRRVPSVLAEAVRDKLEGSINFAGIYFARSKDKYAPKWKIFDVENEDGTINPHFRDIRLKFMPSGALKILCAHVFKLEKTVLFRDIELDRRYNPQELGYAPFALAVGTPRDWKGAWPDVIKTHILHWGYDKSAREYASRDIELTRRLHVEYFKNCPAGDTDSELAINVACARWRGFSVDIPKIKELREAALLRIERVPTAPAKVKAWLSELMSETESKLAFLGGTKRKILETIVSDPAWVGHPVIPRVKEVLAARFAKKEIELYDKLIKAGRFHASFVVGGTLSNRMSGSDSLNPQGIKHDKYVRSAFTLADDWETLSGGDYKSFEVSIAAAVFEDQGLTDTLQSGLKIHAILAEQLYPGRTYEEVLASDGRGSDFPEGDMYDTGKKGVFLTIYGGDENTFLNKLGIPLEIGRKALVFLYQKYPGMLEFQRLIIQRFGALSQPNGLGTKVEWKEPEPYAESFLGFKRYFTLEFQVAKVLFALAENPPEAWLGMKVKVRRRDRVQTACGAVRSALYGAAFQIVASVMRAAKNHYIQSPGAEITKNTQVEIWKLQPIGVHPWVVRPMNIHDEIMCPHAPEYAAQIKSVAQESLKRFLTKVPLLAIDWFVGIGSWAEKKGVDVESGTKAVHSTSHEGLAESLISV